MIKIFLIVVLVTILTIENGQCLDCRTEGQACGGLAANLPAMNCCLGQQLSCVHKDNIPDGTGICTKVCSTEGQICGGFTRDPKVCCSGFKCIVPNTGATDLPGKCHPTS